MESIVLAEGWLCGNIVRRKKMSWLVSGFMPVKSNQEVELFASRQLIKPFRGKKVRVFWKN